MYQCYNRQKKNSVPRTEMAQYRNEISYRKILYGSKTLIKCFRQQNVKRKHYTWIFKESEYNKTGLRIKLQKIAFYLSSMTQKALQDLERHNIHYKNQ